MTKRKKLSSALALLNNNSASEWSPTQLSVAPAAWYQPGVGVTGTLTASNWADQSGNGRDLAQGTAGNQPIYLPYSGTPYGWLPAVNGNAFSCPKPATALTGDICIKARIAPDNASAIDVAYCGKRRAANDFQFTSGATAKKPKFFWWEGAVLREAASTVAHSYSNAQPFWVAVTLDVDDGAGGCVAKFYTSADGDTPSWTLLDTVTQAFTTSIDNGSGFIGVGSDESGGTATGGNFAGKIYRVQIANAADLTATPIVDFQPYAFSETSTNGAIATASTGEVWTLNSTGAKPAQIVKSASLLFDGTDDYLKTASFSLSQPFSIYLVMKQVTWTDNDVIYAFTNGFMSQKTGGASPQIGANAGAASSANGNLALNAYGIVTSVFNGASSTLQVNNTTAVTGDFGSGGIFGGFWLGEYHALGLPSNIIVKELLIFSAAHTAAQMAQMQSWLNSRYGTF